MDQEELRKIAEIHFSTMRTRLKFSHIVHSYILGEFHVFVAMFRGKRTVTVKKIRITAEGVLVK